MMDESDLHVRLRLRIEILASQLLCKVVISRGDHKQAIH